MPNVNRDFLDKLNDVGGQMRVNISHEMRIRRLERASQIQRATMLCVMIALVLIALR